MSNDFFVYNYLLEDTLEYDACLVVRIYALDINNQHVIFRFTENSFRPWLSLELLRDVVPDEIRRFLKGILANAVYHSRGTIVNETCPYYFEKSNVETKLYFHSSKKINIYRLKFKSMKLRDIFYWKFLKSYDEEKRNYKLCEKEASPFIQLLSQFNLPSCGWVSIDNLGHSLHENVKETKWSREYIITPSQMKYMENQEKYKTPIFKTLSFDFEAYNHEECKIPCATDKKDPIFQIGFTTLDSKNEYKKFLFTLSKSEDQYSKMLQSMSTKKNQPSKFFIEHFSTEKDLLVRFCQFIMDFDPILIMGYNILGFDIPFLHHKCKLYGIQIEKLGMMKHRLAKYMEVKWSSSAYSVQNFYYYDWDGRILVDLLPIIKRDNKFSNYKLSTVTSILLKDETKDPMTVKKIFEAYRKGFLESNYKLLHQCGKYCVQDAHLVYLLFKSQLYLIGLIEMARLMNVQIMDLYLKGQQVKVFSQLYRKCYLEKRLVDSYQNISAKDKKMFEFENYTGAYVFPPVPGKYSWVVPFDFTSLYPSVIIAKNICYSTLVNDDKIPDEECHVIKWTEGKTNYCYRFKKSPVGVVPSLLMTLLQQRNTTKKQKKLAKTEFERDIYEKRQLAYKISANSAYGMMGVKKGLLPFLPGAASTTSMGRNFISKAADYVSKKFMGQIVYGDSVHKDSIIFIRYTTGEIKLYTIESYWNFYRRNVLPYEQFKNGESLSHKQQVIFNSDKYKILTHTGWSPIKRLIRHHTTKKMFRVYSTSGIIDVTEDHSLLSDRLQQIKPEQVVPNETLLATIQSYRQEICNHLIYQKEDWNCSFFQIDGFLLFPKDAMSHKYICYVYYNYLKQFPNMVFTFVHHDENIFFGIDLENKQKKKQGLVLKVELLGETTDFVYDMETQEGSFHSGVSLLVKNTDSIYVCFNDIEKESRIVWNHAKYVEKHLLDIEFFPKPMKLLFESKICREFLILTKKRYMAYTTDESGKIDKDLYKRGVILARRDNSSWTRTLYEKIVRAIMSNVPFSDIMNMINDDILSLMRWGEYDKKGNKIQEGIDHFVITKLVNESYKIRPLPLEKPKLKKRLLDLDIDCPILDTFHKNVEFFNMSLETNKEITPFSLFRHENHSKMEAKALEKEWKKLPPSKQDMWRKQINVMEQYVEKCYPAHIQLCSKLQKRGLPVSKGSRLEYIVIQHENDPDSKLFSKLECPDYFMNFCDVLRIDFLYYLKSIVYHADQLLNIVYVKACPKKCTCYQKKKVNMVNRTCKTLSGIPTGPVPLMKRGSCFCAPYCICRTVIYDPIKTIYDYHVCHLKTMKELKRMNQIKITCHGI